MAEFLQSYGIWIFLGLLLFLMLRRRGSGMGCGMGGHREYHGENQQVDGAEGDDGGKHPRGGCH